MATYRLQRIASRIKFLVGTIIQRELSDPRVGLVTVLKVEVTPDLKEAKVHVSIFGKSGERSRTIRALEDARGYVQREVGKNLKTRNTPRLRFLVEEGQDKVSRIEALVVEAKENPEGDMAKKPGKKDDQSTKDEKASKSARRPSKPEKKAPERSAKDEKASKKGEGSSRKGLNAGEGGKSRRKFDVDDVGEDEEKDYPDEFETQDDDVEEDEEDEEDEDVEEEEEEEEEREY